MTDQYPINTPDNSAASAAILDVEPLEDASLHHDLQSQEQSTTDFEELNKLSFADTDMTRFVKVVDPERCGDKEPYVVYTIRTKKDIFDEGSGEWIVKRRFQDFVDYYGSLQNEIDDILIFPPLPSKNNFEFKDKFNPEFIERRRKALERYIMRIFKHPFLGNHALTKRFLSETNIVFKKTNSSTSSIAVASSAAAGGLTSVVEHVSEALSGIGIFSKPNQIEDRFEMMKKVCHNLEGHYDKLEDVFQFLYKAHRTIEEAMKSASHEVMQVGSALSDLQNHLDTNPEEATFSKIAVMYDDQAEASRYLASLLKADVLVPFHECVKYCNCANEGLKKRDDRQFNVDDLYQYVERNKQQLAELKGGSLAADRTSLNGDMLGPIKSSARAFGNYFSDQFEKMKGTDVLNMKQQKISQIEKRIVELESAVKNARESSLVADKDIEREMSHFEKILEVELRDCLLPRIIELHKAFFEKSANRWCSA